MHLIDYLLVVLRNLLQLLSEDVGEEFKHSQPCIRTRGTSYLATTQDDQAENTFQKNTRIHLFSKS